MGKIFLGGNENNENYQTTEIIVPSDGINAISNKNIIRTQHLKELERWISLLQLIEIIEITLPMRSIEIH